MAKAICLVGKICSGKTTYTDTVCKKEKAVLMSVDEIMILLFGLYAGEKHDEYAAAIRDYLLCKSAEILNAGASVVLDWGFWTAESRKSTKEFFENRGIECEFCYLDISDEEWMKRLAMRKEMISSGFTGAYPVDENLAAKFFSLFEEPVEGEVDFVIGDDGEEK